MSKELTMNYVDVLKNYYGSPYLRQTNMRDYRHKNDYSLKWMEFVGTDCPICGHEGLCVVNPENDRIQCMRPQDIPSTKKVVDGQGNTWLKVRELSSGIGDGTLWKRISSTPNDINSSKSFKSTNKFKLTKPIYTDLLNRFAIIANPLVKEDLADLHRRGLTDQDLSEISKNRGFASFRKGHGVLQAKLVKANDKTVYRSYWEEFLKRVGQPVTAWHGVPGFYRQLIKVPGKGMVSFPALNLTHEGMLIPYYNEDGMIIAFQIRVQRRPIYINIDRKTNLSPEEGKLEFKVYRESQTYEAYLTNAHYLQGKKVSAGKITFKRQTVDLSQYGIDKTIIFKGEKGAKYTWISSANPKLKDGTDTVGKWPVQVAYRPEIAQLDAGSAEVKAYKQHPKSVWLTEGGLKAIVTAHLLPKYFTKETLDEVGHDVLAVPGVQQYKKFFPMLRKLNVKSVTIAYDMDMLTNKDVRNSVFKLIQALLKLGYKTRMAIWNLKDGKGIDDILNNPNCYIRFQDYQLNSKGN